MSLIFSLAYLFHHTSHAAPLSALSDRDGDQCIFSDQRRSKEDIIWSSLAVIFACTWVSVRPNIPAHDDSQLKNFLRRAGLMFWTLMVPEVVIVWAMREWYAARRFTKEFPRWTKTHGYFMNMGGFVLFEGQNPRGVLLLETMKSFLQEGKIDLPAITEKEIQDRSKGDGLSKVLAVGQTSWYLLQVIARHFEGLVVTELELFTTAFAVLNVVIYFLWWNKPLDVRCSIPVPLLDILKPADERVVFETSPNMGSIAELQDSRNGPHTVYLDSLRLYENLTKWKSIANSQLARMALWYWTVMNDQHKPRLQRVVSSIAFSPVLALVVILSHIMDMFLPTDLDSISMRVPSFWANPKEAVHLMIPHALISGIIFIGFGSIHCLGWHFQFPSHAELILWRVGSATIVGVPFIGLLVVTSAFLTNRYRVHVSVKVIYGLSLISFVASFFYMIARMILLLEALVALRALQEGAYGVVKWSMLIPHI